MAQTKEQAAYQAAYRAAHAAEIKARKAKYYAEHKTEINEKSAKWTEAHKKQRLETRAAWRAVHAAEIRAYMATWREDNRTAYNAGRAKWQAANKAGRLTKRRQKQYGLSQGQFDAMLAKQGGRCKICGCVPAEGFRVDHSHKTGTVRGLLCHKCNVALGLFRDSPGLLERAADYLREYAAAAEDLRNQAEAELATAEAGAALAEVANGDVPQHGTGADLP